eukprot:TRINITY_DN16055_c0_g1_i1.p3 TRINITY_DN16055_c0_g1~~TRINITY_DN16055_c0_g1_i1.p3  ORF type:complete len:112 (-),score=25.72 TRINITY_DN16055_c0_g1_i1:46-381(-)
MLWMCANFTQFFFFKQKTAYEIMPSLVGSEMCIRDSVISVLTLILFFFNFLQTVFHYIYKYCLLYTSDAADDMQCVDLGGRRIIKKKKQRKKQDERKIKKNKKMEQIERKT